MAQGLNSEGDEMKTKVGKPPLFEKKGRVSAEF